MGEQLMQPGALHIVNFGRASRRSNTSTFSSLSVSRWALSSIFSRCSRLRRTSSTSTGRSSVQRLNMPLNIVQIVLGGDFDIQPHRRVLLDAAPLLQLGGDGGQIAFDYRQRLGHGHLQVSTALSRPSLKLTRCTDFALPVSSKLSGSGEPL